MKNIDVTSILKLDHILITEALRRLTDGTCCLKGDERDFIHDLFEKARRAIKDHIEIEEQGFLPQIEVSDAELMRREHLKLEQLLAETQYTIIEERPISFKALIESLKASLNDHEKVETHIFGALNLDDFDQMTIASIRDRVTQNIV